MNVDTLKQLLELGWPAIVTFMFGYLAIQYIADQRQQIATLWKRVETLESDLVSVKKQLLDDHLARQ